MNIAIVTFSILSGNSEKHIETILQILIMKVSRYFSFGRKDGWSFCTEPLQRAIAQKDFTATLAEKIIMIKTFSKLPVKAE